MNWRSRAVAAAIGALLVEVSAAAQNTTVYVMRPRVDVGTCPWVTCEPGPPRLVEIDVEGARFRSEAALPADRGGSLIATADGRYVVVMTGGTLTSGPRLSVFDRTSSITSPVFDWPIPTDPFRISSIVAHPSEVRVFVTSNYSLYEASADGVTPIDVGPVRQIAGMTVDGHILLLDRPTLDRAIRFDTRTRTVVDETVLSDRATMTLSPHGESIYTHHYGPGSHVYRRVQAGTGTVLAERVEPGLGMRYVVAADPHTGRIYVTPVDGTYDVLDPVTLASLGIVTHTLPRFTSSTRLVFDPYVRRAFMLASNGAGPSPGDGGAVIDVIDVDTLSRIGGGSLGSENGAGSLVVIPRPPAPSDLSATVEGTRVMLQWSRGTGPGRANGFRVEAGSAPGLANLARFDVSESPTLSVEAVPAGSYYVRVRATSMGGVSAASPEIVVTVP